MTNKAAAPESLSFPRRELVQRASLMVLVASAAVMALIASLVAVTMLTSSADSFASGPGGATVYFLAVYFVCFVVLAGGSASLIFGALWAKSTEISDLDRSSLWIGRSQRPIVLGSVAAASLIALGITPFFLFDTTTAGPSGVSIRSWPWALARHYDWSNASVLKTTCNFQQSKGGDGSWNYEYRAVITGAGTISVGGGSYSPANKNYLVPAHNQGQNLRMAGLLADALRKTRIRFDNSGIQSGCHPPDIEALRFQSR